MSAIPKTSIHTLPNKGALSVIHKFKPVDGRTVPSEEALKRIAARYHSWVREIEKREKEKKVNEHIHRVSTD